MSTQEQDKVREPLLKADDRVLDDEGIDEPAEETRRTDYEQRYGKRHGALKRTEPVRDRNRSQSTRDGLSEVCGSD